MVMRKKTISELPHSFRTVADPLEAAPKVAYRRRQKATTGAHLSPEVVRMNKFQALVEIVKAVPPNQRFFAAICAIAVVGFPATVIASGGAVLTALVQ